jgi:hypothetical protein
MENRIFSIIFRNGKISFPVKVAALTKMLHLTYGKRTLWEFVYVSFECITCVSMI